MQDHDASTAAADTPRPPPATPAWLSVRGVGLAAVAMLAPALVALVESTASLAASPLEVLVALGAASVAVLALRWALREPARLGRRCVGAGSLGGLVVGTVVLAVAFVAERSQGRGVAGLPPMLLVGSVTGAVVGALFGAIFWRFALRIADAAHRRGLDSVDAALWWSALWLAVVGGLATAFLSLRADARIASGVVALGGAITAAVLGVARDVRRLRFLARVGAGHEPSWRLVVPEAGEGSRLPPYVDAGSAERPPDRILAHRAAPDGTPFRANERLAPAATVVDAHARRTATRRAWSSAVVGAGAGVVVAASGVVFARMAAYGSYPASLLPRRVDGLVGTPVALALGNGGACATLTDGRVACWGNNADRFPGALYTLRAPRVLEGVRDLRQLALGHAHACGLHTDGAVRCWGGNLKGEVGLPGAGSAGAPPSPPVTVPLDGVAELGLGVFSSCARRTDGTVWCWGNDPTRGTGDPPLERPTRLDGIDGAVALAAAPSHLCALRADRAVVCWGDNGTAQLGRPYDTGRGPAPVAGTPPDAAQLFVGPSSSCVIGKDERAWCWGNWGSPADADNAGNTHDVRARPRTLEGLGPVRALALGFGFSCALRAGGTVACLGKNDRGQLGDGTTTPRFSPAAVAGLSDVVAIAADATRVCARRDDASVWCWGE